MLTFLPSRAVALEVFGFSIHWYGILYALSFIVALLILPELQRNRQMHLSRDEWATVVSYGILGVLVGGRLGYILFYEPAHFAQHPEQILAVWQGGMSSHGGFIGVALALLLVSLRKKIDMRRLADVIVVPAAIGLALGRLANFINQELYGTITNLPWGISVPGEQGLRHPLQIYDMLLSLCIAFVCFLHVRYARPVRPGLTFVYFLMLYSVMRFLLEFIRNQQYPLVEISVLSLTRGQLLTLPMFLIGLLLWVWFRRGEEQSDQAVAQS